ncbi:MAG: 30S ribosomal protein S4 [Candidatus Saganbacteria bacterium]|nr:30S ribosomal protein S4 [Candidatus Saganbacteria bacterium]
MGRHTGPVCKICRREGAKLFLKGEKCAGPKCPFDKRSYGPGQHGQGRKRPSEFGIRLRAKQKARSIYGLSERQFRRYFSIAAGSKGSTGEKLMELLERRLDNVIWRMGLASSRAQARQMVRDGHILVNAKKVNIPSYCVKTGDAVNVREKSAANLKKSIETMKERTVPVWLSFDADNLGGKVNNLPKREDMDSLVEERLIVEFYSR